MDNLRYYDKLREVPDGAKKKIAAGRLKGMTDINPMWRIKKLTETFGPCGIGWYPEIVDTWLDGGANGEISANIKILLYVREGAEWSKGIPGIGGSKFVAKENAGLYTDDEAYKKAFTDAISVAAKLLGVAADVYFEKDSTKYDGNGATASKSVDSGAKAVPTSKQTEEEQKATQSYEDQLKAAMETEMTIKNKKYKVGEMSQEQLLYIRENAKVEKFREAATMVLNHRFKQQMQEAGDDDLPF